MKPELNADLGEGEPAARTRALMRWITMANVACGGHAGDARSMEHCVRLAKLHRVKLGAHPGLMDRAGFGRLDRPSPLDPKELETLLVPQIEALHRIARQHRMRLHHIKLHGALYHLTDRDPRLAAAYVRIVRRHWPGVHIVARANGPLIARARRAGLSACEEAFLDRGYQADGRLVPRGQPAALAMAWADIKERLRLLLESGVVRSVDGVELPMKPGTVCLHADTPHAARWARMAARYLRAAT